VNYSGARRGDAGRTPLLRPPWPLRWAGHLATLAALLLLSLVVADWGWRWLGPAPTVVPAAAPAEPWTPAIVAAGIFGSPATAPPTGGAPAPEASTGAPPAGDTRLLGVFAERDGAGYALFRFADRGPVLVRSGQELSPGVTLDAVLPDRVRIRDRGEMRELLLRAGPARAGAPVARPQAMTRPAPSAACAAPSGFKGGVYRVNAELLTGVAAQPDSWRAILVPAAGALEVRDRTGFAAMLGMRPGDRLAQANGIALASVEDVLAAVVKPLVASQAVRLGGTRDGKPAEWLLLNAGACPP
jgi:hypothetical protein